MKGKERDGCRHYLGAENMCPPLTLVFCGEFGFEEFHEFSEKSVHGSRYLPMRGTGRALGSESHAALETSG